MTSALFNPRERSLIRSNILVLGSLAMSVPLSGFPHLQPNFLLCMPAVLSVIGLADTMRCIQRRWCLYHGGVLFCIYMDLMVISIVWFFFLYPYFTPLTATH